MCFFISSTIKLQNSAVQSYFFNLMWVSASFWFICHLSDWEPFNANENVTFVVFCHSLNFNFISHLSSKVENKYICLTFYLTADGNMKTNDSCLFAFVIVFSCCNDSGIKSCSGTIKNTYFLDRSEMLTSWLTITVILTASADPGRGAPGQSSLTVAPTCRINGHPQAELTLGCGDGEQTGEEELL